MTSKDYLSLSESVIARLYNSGIINGITPDTFNPDAYITRAEFAALINRVTKDSALSNMSFNDVSISSWYYDDIASIISKGIMSGDGNRLFRPESNITRQEMAVVANNVYKYIFNTVPPIGANKGFNDFASIASWAYDSVMFCQNSNLVVGDTAGNFNPLNNLTRAEAAVIVDRLMNLN